MTLKKSSAIPMTELPVTLRHQFGYSMSTKTFGYELIVKMMLEKTGLGETIPGRSTEHASLIMIHI